MKLPGVAQRHARAPESCGAISSDAPVLEVDNVTKTYPGHPAVHALRGVTLRVHWGELVGVMGASGSGKTTLLHVMGTLDRPSDGTVRVTGWDIATLSDGELAVL